MGITARDLFFVLRVRDEATSALNAVTRDLIRVGTAAQVESRRAEAAGLRQQAANMRAAGATRAQTRAVLDQAAALDAEAAAAERGARRQRDLAAGLQSAGKAAVVLGTGLIAVGLIGATALLGTVKNAVEYQRQVALTQTQVDGFSASLEQLSKIGIDTANNIAVPFEAIQPALYDIFSSTDANLSQATTLLEAFSKAAVAGQVSLEDSSRATMGIMNAFKVPFQDVNQILDIQFQLVRKGVGTYGQFANVIGRAIPSVRRYGGSVQDLAGSLAFLTRNGLSPAMAAASVARAFDALDNPKAIANMKSLGINAFDAAGNLRPFTNVITDLSKKILAMPKKDRLAALTDVFKGAGGTIQARRFLDQIILYPDQLKSLITFIDDMKGSTGQFGSAYDKMSKTAAAQTQLLKNRWDTLKVTVGQALTPVLIVLVTWLNKVFTWFENLSPSTQKFIALTLIAASALAILLGVLLVVVGGIVTLAGLFAALNPEVLAVIGVVALLVTGILGMIHWFKELYKDSAPFRKWVASIIKKLGELRGAFVTAWQGIVKAYNKYLKPALDTIATYIKNNILPIIESLTGQGVDEFVKSVKEALRIAKEWAGFGLQVIGYIIEKYVLPMIKSMIKWIQDHPKEMHEFVWFLGQVVKWLLVLGTGSLVAAIVGLMVIFVALVGIVWFLIHAFTILIDVVDEVIAVVKWLWGWIVKIWDAIYKFFKGLTTIGPTVKNALITAFKSAGTWLINAGKDLIGGLIQGIQNALPSLGGVLGSVGNFIASHKGPKAKDLTMLRPHGNWIMTGLISGIDDKMHLLDRTVKGVNATLSQKMDVGKHTLVSSNPSTRAYTPKQEPAKTITQHITVHTQEISPRKHAAELGWELANRM